MTDAPTKSRLTMTADYWAESVARVLANPETTPADRARIVAQLRAMASRIAELDGVTCD